MTDAVVRLNISHLAKLSDPGVAASMRARGYVGQVYGGELGNGLRWVATEDSDGRIELSFSHAKRRPSNWDIELVTKQMKLSILGESSKASGKIRHFVVQEGRLL